VKGVTETEVQVKTADGICFQNQADVARMQQMTGPVNAPGAAERDAVRPDSPHLLAPKIKARMYFGVASNDDQRQPDAKDKLREAFADAKVPAEIEVYPGALHGWCVADMPPQNGKTDLQQTRHRACLGEARGVVQGSARLTAC
jgi:dienelactone hydrolase